nr:MAG TPA: hypothetical protein [Caudoviricetes sp.]
MNSRLAICPVSLAVKTLRFQCSNTGSIPVPDVCIFESCG